MSDSASNIRIQPCLLDRLIDEAPAEKRESRLQRVMSSGAFRECVRRDIANLFNSHAWFRSGEGSAFPRAAQSVLNYGIRDLCGMSFSTLEWTDLERHLAQVLRTFEPRLIPHTVQVKAVATTKNVESPTRIGFEVRAHLWSRPVPEVWFLKTEIDLENGVAAVTH